MSSRICDLNGVSDVLHCSQASMWTHIWAVCTSHTMLTIPRWELLGTTQDCHMSSIS